MKNQEIREALKMSGVLYWELADKLGMTDSTLSKKLRHELSDDMKTKALEAIREIKEAKV